MVDPAESADDACPICGAHEDDFLPREQRTRPGKRFATLSAFSRIVARLQWDASAIDLAADARAWPDLPDARRRRLTTLLAGFCVAEEAVAEKLEPFALATEDTLEAWVFFLQRRDEERHALLFDRVAAEVLGVPGDTAAERRAHAREQVPSGVLELFETRLPAMANELRAGRTGLSEGVSLYHMVLEGIVFSAGQKALLEDLEDGALPGVLEGVTRVDRDERWHIGFGLRHLLEAQPPQELIYRVLADAEEAIGAWGDAVPDDVRERVLNMCVRRLTVVGLLHHKHAA